MPGVTAEAVVVPPGCPLSTQQFRVIARLADDERFVEIGPNLDRSKVTARRVAHNGYAVLGVGSAHHAVARLFWRGWLEWDPERAVGEPGAMVPEGCPLTPGEFVVLLGLCEGLSHEELGARHGGSGSSVRTLAANARAKLGARTAAGAVGAAFRAGWPAWEPVPAVSWPEPVEDPPLPAWAKTYLEVFDVYLRTGDDRARVAMGTLVDGALRARVL